MNPPGLKHRLCAILAADAAGFARLMTADDHATVAALDAARAVFRLQVDAHQGRVIDMAGDSVLAVFETAAGAVAAALAAQEELADLVADVPEDRCMRFRIGVHLGDVIERVVGALPGRVQAAELVPCADREGQARGDRRIEMSHALRGSCRILP